MTMMKWLLARHSPRHTTNAPHYSLLYSIMVGVVVFMFMNRPRPGEASGKATMRALQSGKA